MAKTKQTTKKLKKEQKSVDKTSFEYINRINMNNLHEQERKINMAYQACGALLARWR